MYNATQTKCTNKTERKFNLDYYSKGCNFTLNYLTPDKGGEHWCRFIDGHFDKTPRSISISERQIIEIYGKAMN